MNDLLGMCSREDVEYGVGYGDDISGRELVVVPLAVCSQCLAFEEGHYEEHAPIVPDVIVDDRHDGRVIHLVRELRFAAKEPLDLGIGGEPFVENLDGHGVAIPMRAGVDGAHAADADQANESVPAAEDRPDTQEGAAREGIVCSERHADLIWGTADGRAAFAQCMGQSSDLPRVVQILGDGPSNS
jgi:hypothetical protein